jgi:sugar transferase EpsL
MTSGFAQNLKYTFDSVVSGCLILITLPIILMISLVIYLTMGSPVLFRQLRPGFHGKPFWLYKFRSMINARSNQEHLLTDADRLTPLGRFLRSTSLDELPELFNVLRGDMSLVGPRPLLMQYLDLYTPEQARRHLVKPGISGLTQVNGRNALTWAQKFEFDVWYVDNMTFWLDVKILAMTVWKILRREGINQPGQATMEEFQGTGGKYGE